MSSQIQLILCTLFIFGVSQTLSEDHIFESLQNQIFKPLNNMLSEMDRLPNSNKFPGGFSSFAANAGGGQSGSTAGSFGSGYGSGFGSGFGSGSGSSFSSSYGSGSRPSGSYSSSVSSGGVTNTHTGTYGSGPSSANAYGSSYPVTQQGQTGPWQYDSGRRVYYSATAGGIWEYNPANGSYNYITHNSYGSAPAGSFPSGTFSSSSSGTGPTGSHSHSSGGIYDKFGNAHPVSSISTHGQHGSHAGTSATFNGATGHVSHTGGSYP